MNESSQAITAEKTDQIRAAQKLAKQDRRHGLAALNEIFRAGKPPEPPLDGPYDGKLLAVDIAPGVTQFADWVTSFYMPWKGKQLSAADSQGDNLFGRKSRLFFRLNFPFYWGVNEDRPETFRAFASRRPSPRERWTRIGRFSGSTTIHPTIRLTIYAALSMRWFRLVRGST